MEAVLKSATIWMENTPALVNMVTSLLQIIPLAMVSSLNNGITIMSIIFNAQI